MENATDALKMAGAVLIFVLAISIIILSFGQVRVTADTILDYKDRETTYVYYEDEGKVRTVNLETVIPTILRAHLENYKIVFRDTSGNPITIYTIVQNDEKKIEKKSIDLKEEVLGDNEKKAEFLCGILYHDFSKMEGSSSIEKENYFKNTNFGIKIELPTKSLYEQLQGKTIKEYLGVYYDNDSPDIPESMKEKRRVITYDIK